MRRVQRKYRELNKLTKKTTVKDLEDNYNLEDLDEIIATHEKVLEYAKTCYARVLGIDERREWRRIVRRLENEEINLETRAIIAERAQHGNHSRATLV